MAFCAPATALAVETVHALVMIVDFVNAPAPPDLKYRDGVGYTTVPLDIPNAETVFFNGAASTAARYAEMSQGELVVTGEVIEVSIPLTLQTSTSLEWRPAADAAAQAQGYTLSDYDRLGYLLTRGFLGQIAIGASSENWFWVTGLAGYSIYENYVDHEFGHTVDLNHASEIQANESILEYGDATDFMGSGDSVHANAVHKHRKGWLPGNREQIHPLDTSDTYVLNPLASSQDQLQVVSIDSHGAHPIIGLPVDTFISYRKPIAFDQNLPVATDPYGTLLRDTVHLHYGEKSGNYRTYFDRALDVNDVYVTPEGATIEVLSITGAGAEVEVTQPPYYPYAPIVTATPMGPEQAYSGTTLDYSVSVTNPDAGVSYPAYYETTFTPPGPGWMVTWDTSPKHIVVDPGATEIVNTLRVTSPLGETPGVYSIDLELTEETGSSGPVSTIETISYEVLEPPDTTPPPPPSGLTGVTYPGSGDDYVVLQWLAPPDTSDVAYYQPYRNGVKVTATALLISPDFNYTALESNAYVVRSVDLSGNESVSSNAIVVGVPDVTAPTAPGLSGGISQGQVQLSWTPATDDTWVYRYEIYRDGVLIGTTEDTSYTDASPPPGSVTYTVYAVDGAGNASPAADWFYGGLVPSLGPTGLGALCLALAACGALRARPRLSARAGIRCGRGASP